MSLTHILVIGPRCWGKGTTLKQAVMRAIQNYSGQGPMPYVAYATPADAEVDETGAIVWDDGSIKVKKIRSVSYQGGKQKVETFDS